MRDLIVFGEDFTGLPSSTQHLIRTLAHTRRVLWVNSIGLRQPKWTLSDLKRAGQKLLGRGKGGYANQTRQHPNIQMINLRTVPAPRSALARRVARDMMIAQLKPWIQKLKLRSPILWTSLPTAADLCGHLGESAVVYYCGDDFSSLAGVDHACVAQHEATLVEHADLILTSGAALLTRFPASKTHYLPHGVDLELFESFTERAQDLPNDGKPIAGFYGSLSNWLDYPLIDAISARHPEWHFVFIGPQELSHNPLPKRDNVHYLGPKAHHELPQYSQHWSVGLLPFVDNEQITACNPLKLREYLAAGKPVISSRFPAALDYKNHLHLIDGVECFSRALREIETQRTHKPAANLREESWQARGKEVATLLEAL